jgi:hypothetical protein
VKRTEGFVIEIKIAMTGKYASYTSAKRPLDEGMGKSLSEYLKRQNSPGRLIKMPEGEIVDEW